MNIKCFWQTDFHKLSLTKHPAECLFQNARQTFSNTRPSFPNTRPSFWSINRKLKARPAVWKARPSLKKFVLVFVLQHSPCCPNQSRLKSQKVVSWLPILSKTLVKQKTTNILTILQSYYNEKMIFYPNAIKIHWLDLKI